ncbi:MAG TPA: hypothetical protein VKM93_20815 [Terriglobia bacterium]|nr:hypothetical protein [Terriglobia bacterium]
MSFEAQVAPGGHPAQFVGKLCVPVEEFHFVVRAPELVRSKTGFTLASLQRAQNFPYQSV